MSSRSMTIGLGLGAMFASVAVTGHHSVEATFDTNNPFEIAGVIDGIIMVNPHAYLLVTTQGADGETQAWAFESAPPRALTRAGLGPDKLAAGAEIVLTAVNLRPGLDVEQAFSVYRDDASPTRQELVSRAIAGRLGHATRLVLADGTEYEEGSDGIRWMSVADPAGRVPITDPAPDR